MIEVYEAWLMLPLNVKLICMVPLTALPLLWMVSPARTNPWSYAWERRIDNEIRLTRKRFSGEARVNEMRCTFARLITQLEIETGGTNFLFLDNPEHRCVWMYLYRKIHYTL